MSKYKKRADGRYATQILIGYQDNGKRKVKTIYGRTIIELEKKVVEFKALLNQGIILDSKNYTLNSWSKEWFNTYGTKGLRSTTIASKQTLLNHILKDKYATLPLDKISSWHCQQIINTVYDSNPSSTKKIHSMLIAIFDCGIKNNLLLRNAAKDVEVPKYTAKKKRALSKEEQNALRNCDLNIMERVFVSLALDCGLRKGEILALSLSDFDFKKDTVTINKNFIMKTRTVSTTPKTNSSYRTVPIGEDLKDLIKSLVKENDNMQLFLCKSRPFSGKTFENMWNSIVTKLVTGLGDRSILIDGLSTKDITPHILRHTFATNMFYAGIDIKAAQYLLGHTNIETTLKIYTHLNLDNEDIKHKLQTYIKDMSISQKSVSKN